MAEIAELNRIFAGGRWTPATGADIMHVYNPADGSRIGRVTAASVQDVELASLAALEAFAGWRDTAVSERAAIVARIADGLAARAVDLADGITLEVGTPRHKCVRMQVTPAVETFKSAARLGPKVLVEEQLDATRIRKVPVGVVACITPWNYPLYQIASKVAAALMAGCTIVLKPSEVAPTNAAILADVASAAGLPPGVFNVVFGNGPTTGEALISHPAIDFVSFTGSTRAGARIAAIAGQHIKQVSLELGGKSASLVLPGVDLQLAVSKTLEKSFQNSGQTCAALTRLLVPSDALAQVSALLKTQVASFPVGNPSEASTVLGPVATADQRDKVLSLTAAARKSGAELLASGPVFGDPSGFYVPAEAYLTDADGGLAQEEVFGPVLAVVPYSDIDEAVDMANNSPYGLSGAVWGQDREEAGKVAARIRTGSVSINGAATHPDAPFGGFRMSGFGRERGAHGIEEFLTTQSIHF
ncbi:aldehyde dehydrogenase family protein [Arthrobacter sp. 24S4-2]|uniref:aldehyde dehydrogenase family protein n=1 Tax=Arthrobacter sp. 24S4-2 TaxID=2575374 RepID=UPI0010C7E1F3|nr:aldehyde dehydrogenase family protein [Arthrobacter sp. 24S4-2]QCO98060.1 aldehyde dehydrogenase family protein [Arthrobacter sp. 24S4-2]